MKQHVNLHQLELRKARPALAAARMAQLGAAALVLLVGLGAHAWWRTRQAEQSLETARSLRAAESTRLVELASLYPPKQVEPGLEVEAARLAAERDARARLLGLLGSQSLGNTRGFSEHVAGIARRRVPGLWLRELRIERGGGAVALHGSALEPDLVPRFLLELGQEEAFAGHAFRSLRIERAEDEPGRIDFSLVTDPESGP